ncbi:MAG TPA: LPS assembly lipoprotein LptE [Pusillimonas sp.]|uniref:LPS-assembly lipoprotein LptE n=1 Tax=Pusillimonas sp. TaxID=3040095 RepID=UPI002CC4CF29|nr:LPS assembly lipoprotein LptE [Pusillimonas sp.]HUH86687.1 LPS assembly lipoprotein LptE [Pusillimonas sp.]
MHATAHRPIFIGSRLGLRALACVLLLALLAACGFRLKGATPLPFDTLYTNIAENSAFGADLRRLVVATSPNTRFVSDVTQAQARLTQLSLQRSMREIAISPDGLVEEYELNLIFVFQLTDAQGRVLLPPTTLRSTREVPYDPNAIQAKQGEIGSLFQEMQRSLIDRIVRRLTSPEVIEAYNNRQSLAPDSDTIAPAAPDAPSDNTVPAPGVIPLPGPDMAPSY